MSLNKRKNNQSIGIALPWLTFGLIFIATLLFVYLAALNQQKHIIRLFDNLAERQSQNLKALIDKDLNYIGAAANFFHTVDPDGWNKFSVFSKEIVENSPSLIGLQWMPRVRKDNLDAHIEEVRKEFPDMQLYTIPHGQLKKYGYIFNDSADIYMVSDVYPRGEENEKLIGFYSSRERFQNILDNIKKTGQFNISDKVRLLQDGSDKRLNKEGILVFHPVYSNKEQKLLGVMVGVIRVTRYFEHLLYRTAVEQSLVIQVKDIGYEAEDDPILFESAEWSDVDGLKIRKTISLQNREWVLKFRLLSPMTANDKWILASITLCGLIVAILAAFVVNLISKEKYRLAKKLDERTRELRYLVEHDTLTGIYNRRAFNQYFADQIDKKEPFTLVGFDIDKFKVINDQHGHAVGDAALKHVADLLNEELDNGDFFARVFCGFIGSRFSPHA